MYSLQIFEEAYRNPLGLSNQLRFWDGAEPCPQTKTD